MCWQEDEGEMLVGWCGLVREEIGEFLGMSKSGKGGSGCGSSGGSWLVVHW